MTVEYVLILALYAFILMGAFARVPDTFNQSAPRLAAKIEHDISIGKGFNKGDTKSPIIEWKDPRQKGGG